MTKEAIQRRNNVRIFGKGTKTILFAHGFGCDQQVWSKITPAFEEEFQIVLFDYVGSGHSDKSAYTSERYSTPEGYAADVLDICKAFNLKDIIFVGHSISGVIGLLASIANSAFFDKLFLIGPSPCYINQPGYTGGFDKADIDELIEMMERNYKEWVKYLAPISSKNSDRPELTEEFEEILMANDQEIVKNFCEMTFNIDVREDLKKVKTSTVILQSKEDSIVPLEIAYYLHNHLENSELVLMEATGHNPHLSYPEETIYHIKKFIGR